MGNKRFFQVFLVIMAFVMAGVLGGMLYSPSGNSARNNGLNFQTSAITPVVPAGYSLFDYNRAAAVNYGNMVDKQYASSSTYPSGLNQSVMQKNLDNYGSEDCAHFVSEALIRGGLTVLAQNPPGDNLQGYDGGKFVGSYGIVGVYRLGSYLLGYVPPVFSTNATAESTLQYQPVPASFQGSPLMSVYYVMNESMLPAYYLTPGDVIMDGGAGGGHAMLYIGNGTVAQTDADTEWQYTPGADYNISFYGLDTLNGQNVSAIYLHMPTFNSVHSVNITALYNNKVVKNAAQLKQGSSVYLIGSFPNGVGLGNYTYHWTDNGKSISDQQNFTFKLQNGENKISLSSTGTNGTAYDNFTVYSGSASASSGSGLSYIELGGIIAAIVVIAAVAVFAITRRKH